jgi:hypothetical protein
MLKTFLQTTFIIFSLAATLVASDSHLSDEIPGYAPNQIHRFYIQTVPRYSWQPYVIVRFRDQQTLEVNLDAFKVQELPLLKRIRYDLTGYFGDGDLRTPYILDKKVVWRTLAALSQCVIPAGSDSFGATALGLERWETSFINPHTIGLVDDRIEEDVELQAQIRDAFHRRFPTIRCLRVYSQHSASIIMGDIREFFSKEDGRQFRPDFAAVAMPQRS